MATLTISKAHAQLAQLAQAINTDLPRITTFAPVDPTERERERVIHVLAESIRSADNVLEALRTPPAAESDDAAQLITIAKGLRHAALLLMRAYNPEQAWFWTPEWQEGERAIDAGAGTSRGTIYHSDQEFLAALDAEIE